MSRADSFLRKIKDLLDRLKRLEHEIINDPTIVDKFRVQFEEQSHDEDEEDEDEVEENTLTTEVKVPTAAPASSDPTLSLPTSKGVEAPELPLDPSRADKPESKVRSLSENALKFRKTRDENVSHSGTLAVIQTHEEASPELNEASLAHTSSYVGGRKTKKTRILKSKRGTKKRLALRAAQL